MGPSALDLSIIYRLRYCVLVVLAVLFVVAVSCVTLGCSMSSDSIACSRSTLDGVVSVLLDGTDLLEDLLEKIPVSRIIMLYTSLSQ